MSAIDEAEADVFDETLPAEEGGGGEEEEEEETALEKELRNSEWD